MTEVTILTKVSGHTKGDTVNMSDGAAQYLITNGYAEATSQTEVQDKPPRKANPKQGVRGDSDPKAAVTAG